METFKHIPDYVFRNCVKDNRGLPLYKHDVVLASATISSKLHKMRLMSIGIEGARLIHHYNAQVLTALEKLGVVEEK